MNEQRDEERALPVDAGGFGREHGNDTERSIDRVCEHVVELFDAAESWAGVL